jgi:glycosyltransferase involved in cell wall biosynthesis
MDINSGNVTNQYSEDVSLKILHIVNSISPTSIPKMWIDSYERKNELSIVPFKAVRIRSLKKYDVVHLHHIKSGAIISILLFLISKKAVFTTHGSYNQLSGINKVLYFIVSTMVGKIVFVNESLLGDIPDIMKRLFTKKIIVIPNGVDVKSIQGENKVDVLRLFNITNKDKIIFHPARFVVEKNHINILHAFANIIQDFPDSVLVLAGDGPLKMDITNEIKILGLESHVLLVGTIPRSEVYSFMSISNLFIMPSLSEGLNVAFLEALSLECKILISKIPSYEEYFNLYAGNPEDYNVILANPYSVESIRAGIITLFKTARNQNLKLDFISIDKMFSEYDSLYNNL